MKFAVIAILVVMAGGVAPAQETQDSASSSLPAQSLAKGAWDFGIVTSGGMGLGYATGTHFVDAGGRVGFILTGDHGTGWRRGNFEWAAEMLPLYTVFTPRRAVYGGSFKPAVWRWNFTRGQTIAPYVSIAGGILFTTRNIPPGKTSWVNFTPQAALGANIFIKRNRAVLL